MKSLSTIFLILLISFASKAQDRKLKAYVDNKQFFAPEIGNYVEYHLQFSGTSINYKGKDGGLIGDLAVKMTFLDLDSIVVQQDAYRLETPFMKDSLVEDFYDVKRFQLDAGTYEFRLELMDLNSKHNPIKFSEKIVISDMTDAISLSDIEVAEYASKGDGTSPFFKSGYDIIPRILTFYPQQLSSIPVYFEIYNTEQLPDTVFAIRQTVVNAATGAEIPQLKQTTRHFASPVVPVLRNLDISMVPTGKFILTYKLLNRNMLELAEQTYEFERSNDNTYEMNTADLVLDPSFQNSITDDSVGFYLESLIPISNATGIRNIIAVAKAKNADEARKHIQLYWMATDPENTYESWIKYKNQVLLVERVYSNNFQEGFETDRGRVYLQYGPPTNIIKRENSTNEYPFEIWVYNEIGKFSNKRFIFYNPDLVNNTYRLLHSDMIGELKNPGWQQELAKRNTAGGNAQDANGGVQDQFGGNANEYYEQY
ncbi:MAG: GWxTD domain-containing protein [Crocinitomicaceae bacterium]|nr:GWxTD domain-containing protein [Crocinitomicaceae bacterium]